MDPFKYYRHLRHTTRYVENHLREPIGLHDVAHEVGLSPTHYSAFFHKATGIRFKSWLGAKRIALAKQMLQESDHAIYQIAIDVGFGSVSAFERAFRVNERMPPSRFRKIYRDGMVKGFAEDLKKYAENPTI